MLIRDKFGFKHISHDPNLEIQRYVLTRADHPSNVKKGGVCIYYKKRPSIETT